MIITWVHLSFAGKEWQNLMDNFDKLCGRICVFFADEKTEVPTKKLHYWELQGYRKYPDKNVRKQGAWIEIDNCLISFNCTQKIKT